MVEESSVDVDLNARIAQLRESLIALSDANPWRAKCALLEHQNQKLKEEIALLHEDRARLLGELLRCSPRRKDKFDA